MTDNEIKAAILRKLEAGPRNSFGRNDFPVNNRAVRIALALSDLIREGKVVRFRPNFTGETMFKLRPENQTPAEIAETILQAVADATDLIWFNRIDGGFNLWTIATDGATLSQIVAVHEALNDFFTFCPPFQPLHWDVDSGRGWTLWKSIQGRVRIQIADAMTVVEVRINP